MLLALTLAAISATSPVDVWVESSLAQVYPASTPGSGRTAEISIHAARGERESVQLCVRLGSERPAEAAIETTALADVIPEASVRLVGYVNVDHATPRSASGELLQPGPLLPLVGTTTPLLPGRTTAFWLSFEVPLDADPAVYTGEYAIDVEGRRRVVVPVRVEVFDFALPATPGLPVLARFDRETVGRVLEAEHGDLAKWRPLYQQIVAYGISVPLWGDDLVRPSGISGVDAAQLKEHLSWVGGNGMSVLEVGDPVGGVGRFREPASENEPDPLQLYLKDMGLWLDVRGWLDKSVFRLGSLPPRPQWDAIQLASLRLRLADRRFRRLVSGEPHPSLERFAEIWAIPLYAWHPSVVDRLRRGYSLCAPPSPEAARVAGSESTRLPRWSYESRPEDAYDGSLFTAWAPKVEGDRGDPVWLQIELAKPVDADEIVVGFLPGMEGGEVSVQTSYSGVLFSRPKARWDHSDDLHKLGQSWARAEFSMTKRLLGVQISVAPRTDGRPIAINEIQIGAPPQSSQVERIAPVAPWLALAPGRFPCASVDAHPVEIRMAPWICWGHGLIGVLMGDVAAWPASWLGLAQARPATWTGLPGSLEMLLYPGRGEVMGSVQAERLRDGLEDYVYLQMEAALRTPDGEPAPSLLEVKPIFYDDPSGSVLEAWTNRIESTRILIGRRLTRPESSPAIGNTGAFSQGIVRPDQ